MNAGQLGLKQWMRARDNCHCNNSHGIEITYSDARDLGAGHRLLAQCIANDMGVDRMILNGSIVDEMRPRGGQPVLERWTRDQRKSYCSNLLGRAGCQPSTSFLAPMNVFH
jgi:hypothetical protein